MKSKKVLDVFSLEETLPDLLDFLLGMEDSGGVGLSAEQVRSRRGRNVYCFAWGYLLCSGVFASGVNWSSQYIRLYFHQH